MVPSDETVSLAELKGGYRGLQFLHHLSVNWHRDAQWNDVISRLHTFFVEVVTRHRQTALFGHSH